MNLLHQLPLTIQLVIMWNLIFPPLLFLSRHCLYSPISEGDLLKDLILLLKIDYH